MYSVKTFKVYFKVDNLCLYGMITYDKRTNQLFEHISVLLSWRYTSDSKNIW